MTDNFPTFVSWLTTVQVYAPRSWRIAPLWRADAWADQQRSLLRMLSVATAEKLAVGPLVAQFARDNRGFYRGRLLRLARRIAEGAALPDAIEQTLGVLSPEQTLAIRFGSESGTLQATLATMVGEQQRGQPNPLERLHHALGYVAAFFAIATILLSFITIEILPVYRRIFSDFNLDTPPSFDLLASCTGFIGSYWALLVIALAAVWWLFYTQRGWLYFHRVWLPRISRSAGLLRGAEVLRLLAVAHQHGRPLAGAISTLARYAYDRQTRMRLLFVRNEIELGAGVWQSMRESELITAAEASALAKAPDKAALTWTLQKLAESRGIYSLGRTRLLVELLHPLAILMLAAIVLLVVAGVFTPLVTMILELA